ncbi:malto-oligosyltrehalose trehalohydrolase [Rhizobium oryzicola]|uniref:Malto-oligosyltrehalose trehalohydrolase n=1 Tax=Rhizobium oryzicola TaxID=1232668 RepID=A0ABT8T0F1_9HYPH|nr:malto-oligosyltrehalose trehalohydrolase [Rhizobium oryzicola]MDO1584192.1 malto-oligosyltrehalose trehalohydrolase [Rhizobium oryzicola]
MTELLFGPVLSPSEVLFRFWAPLHDRIQLKIEGREVADMEPRDHGWHELTVEGVGASARYSFILPDGLAVPDPASRYQPHDVHGPSEVVDLTSYSWKQTEWKGRPVEELVLYELHIGAFTPEGTFLAAIDKLDHLKELGVTAIQIMPVADFPGAYGWGYDGVLPYAPDSSYGRPEDLMALIDAAHERGICVFLDVVYNHFGPDGNYLPVYAPLFTDRHKTPWGNGINYDGDSSVPIREFVIHNAIYWVTQFRVDGLRLDAVHAIRDDSWEHLLDELARRVREAAGDRHVHLVVENEDNNSDLLRRDPSGKPLLYTAQWNDDIHHVLHRAATGEDFGYYADYQGGAEVIGKALAEGFIFQGEMMPYRGETRGKPTLDLPPTAFISFIQNHDQIGNRALGDRMVTAQPAERLRAIAAVYLLAPQLPMLFMGEEWGAPEPFPYFCDFDEELNEKVRKGRREELSRLPGFDADDLQDPTARETFESAKLDWAATRETSGENWLSFYRDLLRVRRESVVPLLKNARGPGCWATSGEALVVEWQLGSKVLQLLANLSGEEAALPQAAEAPEELLHLGSIEAGAAGPWSVKWSLRNA